MLIKTPALKLCIITIALALPTFAQEWKPLLNGKDLSGWEHVGPGSFVVGQGMLKTDGGMGLLWYTREKFGNVVLRVVYKTSHLEDKSGVFIRIPEPPADPWYAVHYGYEVQILEKPPAGMPEDPYHTTGAIYSIAKALGRAAKPPGQWNTMEIRIEGPKTTVVLNGVKVNEYREGDPVPPRLRKYEPERGPRPDAGYIGLQNHHADAEVYFREVDVRPLTK